MISLIVDRADIASSETALAASLCTCHVSVSYTDLDVLDRQAGRVQLAMKSSPEKNPRYYSTVGLVVDSDLPLPLPSFDALVHQAPDLMVRLMRSSVEGWLSSRGCVIAEAQCDCDVHLGRIIARLWEGDDDYWLWKEAVATFKIQPTRGRIDVYPEFGVNERLIAQVLSSDVFTLQRTLRSRLKSRPRS